MLSLSIFDVVTSRLGRDIIATMLAIVPGLGHIYLGAARRGIAILAIGIGLVLIAYPGYANFQYMAGMISGGAGATMITAAALMAAGLAAVALWIWQALDARKIVKQQTSIEAA